MFGPFRTFRLLHYFAFASLVAFTASTFILWNLFREKSLEQLIDAGEARNTALAQVLANGLRHHYGSLLAENASLSDKALRNHPEMLELSNAISKSLEEKAIAKIKIFDRGGRTIFSTDPKQIGKKTKSNGFIAARAGKTITKMDHQFPSIVFQQKRGLQHLLSSYIPIGQGQNNQNIEGVFEVYTDITPLLNEIEKDQRDALSALIVTFGLLYGALFMIVYYSDRILTRQMSALQFAEDELEKKNQQLAQSNAELEQFAYVASHDLQEPLRKIEAFGDRLQSKYKDELGDKGKEYIDRMQNAAGRMRTLIQDLLEFSRVSGKAQPFDAVDLKEVIQGVLSDLETRIEETGSSIEVGNLPILDADPLQMRQLFQNLLGNALKFRRTEEPLKVIVQSQPSQNSQKNGNPNSIETCRITVCDNGIGFEQKYTDRIFKVFQRLHSKSEYAGTGIGLAVCAKIVERHGGSISAESGLGQGATFIITLPLQQ